ncbi:hypothetical protein [Antarcticimicrobium luteum]|uniref:Dienelactone hydrolase n=1 Tax=Antarcticimicrobium luteum TaxID=2547397 RepID=A0A4R5UQQ0_9RHOB|nr:hypothetical protein [Antarcticimicrobium luteum]TDK41384.1 hypothetical protein E1832_22135 [Antarcticimicrobium luteum]
MRWALGVALALALGAGTGARAADELQRTWDAAWVFAPAEGAAGYARLSAAELAEHLAAASPRAVVVYAHGCDGLSEISAATGRFLAQAGVLTVAPDSFARTNKPKSCDPGIPRGGLHRAVLGWRQAEMRFAAERLRALAPDLPLILMGQSEGGITTATIPAIGADGRVIEGWTCHAGWPEYRGLNAPEGQPVLSLVGADDPWFRAPVLHGECGAFMQGPEQRAIVYRAPSHLAGKHWLSSDRDVQKTILDFILTIANDTKKNRGH